PDASAAAAGDGAAPGAGPRAAVRRRPPITRSEELTRGVARIIAQVRADGDAALRALTRRFDGCELARLELDAGELAAIASALDARTRAAIDEAHARIEAFHRQTAPAPVRGETAPGVGCERVL